MITGPTGSRQKTSSKATRQAGGRCGHSRAEAMLRSFLRQAAEGDPGKRCDQRRQHRLDRHHGPDIITPADADQHRLQGIRRNQQHEGDVLAQLGLVSADHPHKQDYEQQGDDERQGNEDHDRQRGSKAGSDRQ